MKRIQVIVDKWLNEYWFDAERANVIFGYSRMPKRLKVGFVKQMLTVLSSVTLCQCILNYVGKI